jgi:hypothetical protein
VKLKTNDKRQIITIGIGGLAALATAVINLFSTVPLSLKDRVSDTAWTVTMTCSVPVIIMLVALQVS